jgi:hypothetical protein
MTWLRTTPTVLVLVPARKHGLSITLICLFLISIGGESWAGWYAYNADQQSHAQPRALGSGL